MTLNIIRHVNGRAVIFGNVAQSRSFGQQTHRTSVNYLGFISVDILPGRDQDYEESVGHANDKADRSAIQKHKTHENDEE